jgi:hypothetical protein
METYFLNLAERCSVSIPIPRARSVRQLTARGSAGVYDADCTRALTSTVILNKLNATHALHTHDLDRARATIALLCHEVEAWDDGLAANIH